MKPVWISKRDFFSFLTMFQNQNFAQRLAGGLTSRGTRTVGLRIAYCSETAL